MAQPSWIRSAVALLLLASGPLLSGGDGKFELFSQQEILTIPLGNASGNYGALSFDGKKVLIVKAGALLVRPFESPVETELLPKGSIASALGAWASWSADGKFIYYLKQAPPTMNDLWRLGIATGKNELLIKDAGGVFSSKPSVSPDGKSIAFYRGKVLMLARADGANPRVLCESCDPSFANMAWSPDSSQIVVAPRFSVAGQTTLLIVKVATGEIQSLRPQKGYASSIAWPSWSNGPFLCMTMIARGDDGKQKMDRIPIFHLALPEEKWTEITPERSIFYTRIFGSGPEPNTLIAQRMPPPPDGWDFMMDVLHKIGWPVRSEFQPTVILTMTKQ